MQTPNKLVTDANTLIAEKDHVNSSCDVTTEHRWAFEIASTVPVNPDDLPQNLQFAVDKNTNVLFLIDTGCEVSLLPKDLTNGVQKYYKPFTRAIQGIGENELHPIGTINVELQLGDLRPIKYDFWVTQEFRSYGIIGLDILEANRITIAPHKSEIYDEASKRTAKLFAAANLPKPVVARINKA